MGPQSLVIDAIWIQRPIPMRKQSEEIFAGTSRKAFAPSERQQQTGALCPLDPTQQLTEECWQIGSKGNRRGKVG
jgi:hypothetical protein